MDIEAQVNPNEKPIIIEAVIGGIIWTAKFFSDQLAMAERQKRLVEGSAALLVAARRVRDWLDTHLIPNFRKGLYHELGLLDDAIAKTEPAGTEREKPPIDQLIPIETWHKLCDILGCSTDLPYGDVLIKADILAKSWKEGGQ